MIVEKSVGTASLNEYILVLSNLDMVNESFCMKRLSNMMTSCVSFDFHIVFLFEAGFGVLPHSVNGNYILENMILFFVLITLSNIVPC